MIGSAELDFEFRRDIQQSLYYTIKYDCGDNTNSNLVFGLNSIHTILIHLMIARC